MSQQDEAHLLDDAMTLVEPTRCSSSARLASPSLSSPSQSSAHIPTLPDREAVQLPSRLEHEIHIDQDFDKLGKETRCYGFLSDSIFP